MSLGQNFVIAFKNLVFLQNFDKINMKFKVLFKNDKNSLKQ